MSVTNRPQWGSDFNAKAILAQATAAAGAVGTYAFCYQFVNSGGTVFGSTVPGSYIRFADAAGHGSGTVPSGTWMCMGYDYAGNATASATTVWLRIA